LTCRFIYSATCGGLEGVGSVAAVDHARREHTRHIVTCSLFCVALLLYVPRMCWFGLLLDSMNVDLTYFVFSEHPELRNKIGIGFTSKPYLKDRIDTQFCFIDVSKKFKLKDERRLDFLKLLSFSLPNSEADSIVNMKLNNIQSSLHILDISNMDNDSLPELNHLISRLFRSYEVDFINNYYSGVNNSYEFSSDNWGNRATTSVKPAKYTVSVYDEDGIVSKKNVIPYSMNMIGVSLYFEKWSSNKKKRQVYPGIRYNVISTNGTHLGSASVYLHPSDIKHFKEESRVLFEYLSQIHN
jgi:hypothetical protein